MHAIKFGYSENASLRFRSNQPAVVRGLALGSLAEESRRRPAASSSFPAHPSACGGKCLAAVTLPVFALVEPVDPRNFGYWPRLGCYRFRKDRPARVILQSGGAGGQVVIEAVGFAWAGIDRSIARPAAAAAGVP